MYNKDGEINYETVKDVAGRIASGTLEISRLTREEERGRLEGDRRNVEASIIAGANASTDRGASKGSQNTRLEQIANNKRAESALEKYAKHEGIWFDYDGFTKNQPLVYTRIKPHFSLTITKNNEKSFWLKFRQKLEKVNENRVK
ncbi:MAG: hypothetical protein JSS81_23315 [Acidobacteria bacterium]|nr:hypothetical protein [Acidobacteriota bacterium]